MIVVLGPAELAEALVATAPGELVVGARDDERLGQDVVVAAEVASALPLPARACVVAAWTDPVLACEAARTAGGSLTGARLYVLGDPPSGMELAVWNVQIGRAGAVPVRDMEELRAALEGPNSSSRPAAAAEKPKAPGRVPSEAPPRRSKVERRAMRPGAPEAAAWRAALRAAPTGRLSKLLRRRHLADASTPEATLDATIRRPLRAGCHSVAVISPKGGVGKTTLTYLLGSVLAKVRRERVLVVDTNPDFGTLADITPAIVPATLSDLLDDLADVGSYEALSAYTTTTETGMHILAAPQDPVEMGRLGRDGYQAVSEVLHQHYDVVIYDCGTGFLDEITQFALRRVDQVVLVTTPSLVTTKIIIGAVDHLGATGFDPSRTTLALNMVRRDDLLDRSRLRISVTGRVGGSTEVPFDERVQHAMDTGEFRYESLGTAIRLAMKRLAAEVVGRMPRPDVTKPRAEPVPSLAEASSIPAEPADVPAGSAVAAEGTGPVPPDPTEEPAPSDDGPAGEHPILEEDAPEPAGPAAAGAPAAGNPGGDGRDAPAPAASPPSPVRRGRRLAFDWDPQDPDAE